jgi:hypothetical protein
MLIFEISQASFLISCFSLKISCEIKKISWQHAAMLADFLMPWNELRKRAYDRECRAILE